MTRHTMEGRAPLQITGNRLLFMSRDGNSLQLHDASVDSTFKSLDEVKVCLNLGTYPPRCGQVCFQGLHHGNKLEKVTVAPVQFSTQLQN